MAFSIFAGLAFIAVGVILFVTTLKKQKNDVTDEKNITNDSRNRVEEIQREIEGLICADKSLSDEQKDLVLKEVRNYKNEYLKLCEKTSNYRMTKYAHLSDLKIKKST